jgi:beta-phosphoglucomutase
MMKLSYTGVSPFARAALFDLDGVICDTAQFHFLAWQRLTTELGFSLDSAVGESLKGVGREAALDLVLRSGGITLDAAAAADAAARKNLYYNEHVDDLDSSALIAGARDALETLRERGIPVVLASASRNAQRVLQSTGIAHLFDDVVDGIAVSQPKPHPAVFEEAARRAGVDPSFCVVFEDADAGVAGATAAGCFTVGVGRPGPKGANLNVDDLTDTSWTRLFTDFPSQRITRP